MSGTVIYTVQMPDGTEHDIEGPEGASPADLQAAVEAQFPSSAMPADGSVDPETGALNVSVVGGDNGDITPPMQEMPTANPDYATGLLDSTKNTIAGIAQGLSAIPDAATNALGAVMAEGASGIGNAIGAGADAIGLDGQGARDVGAYLKEQWYKPITIGAEIEKVAPTPQDGVGWGVRLASQLVGGGASVPGVTTLPKSMITTAPKSAAAATPAQAAVAAADRLGLGGSLLAADTGGVIARQSTAIASQMPGSAPFIIKAARRLNDKAGQVVADEAAKMGTAQTAQNAGEAALEGAEKYIRATSKAGSRMYDTAANLSDGVRIKPTNARRVLDEQIARLEAVPGGGQGLAETKQLRAALEGDFNVQGIRDMRTEMFVHPDLRGGPVEARMRAVTNAAAQDVVEGLTMAGKPEAAKAFAAADKYWAERLETIAKVIDPMIGKSTNRKGGEEVIKNINAAMVGKNARLASFIRALPEVEQGVVRASVLAPLGVKEGQFSLSAFASDWDKIGGTAKSALFSAEARAALEDVATLGREAKAAMKYANHSNTGRAVVGGTMLGGAVTGGLGLVTLGKALAAQAGVGALLASPRFARWIARAPKGAAIPQPYINKLGAIAAAEPAIANDVFQLRQRLADAFSQGSGRAAADDRSDTQ